MLYRYALKVMVSNAEIRDTEAWTRQHKDLQTLSPKSQALKPSGPKA